MTTERISQRISANIAFYRKSNHFTQRQLADALGIKSTTVSTWERGTSLPSADTLFEICDLFGISINELYGVDSSAAFLSSVELKLVQYFRQASTEIQQLVLAALHVPDEKNTDAAPAV